MPPARPRLLVLLLLFPLLGASNCAPPQTAVRPDNPTCLAPPSPPRAEAPVHVALDPAFDGTTFGRAVGLHQSSVDPNVFWVAQNSGLIRRIVENPDGSATVTTVLNIRSQIEDGQESGLYGMAFHPDFQTNGYVFVSYSAPGGSPYVTTFSRFHSDDGGLSFDPDSEEIILALTQPHVFHNGGAMTFGLDGFLYLGLGDGGDGRLLFRSQNTDSLYGSIARIDVDGALPYTIPPGNPFAQGGGAPEIFAWGIRQPWRVTTDSLTGDIWVGDVGWKTWEEVDLIVNGGNYGWPWFEGDECIAAGGCAGAPPSIPPLSTHLHASMGGDGQAVMGGFVYRGTALPELAGAYVYGDLLGNLWALMPDDSLETLLVGGPKLFGFGEGQDGELYVLANLVYRLVEDTTPDEFPRRLSETGCVDPDDPTQPVPAMIPYDVNVPLWSDGSEKLRWLALPDGETIDVLPDHDWDLPIGSVLMKEFRIGDERVETRLLVRHDSGEWGGYTYAWDAAESEATYVPEPTEIVVGGQDWLLPGPTQCFECHSAPAGRSLGPRTQQMSREQLLAFEAMGFFTAPLGDVRALPQYPVWEDPSGVLNERARAYLDVNCSHCHQPDGSAQSTMDLRFAATEAQLEACSMDPLQSDLGVPGAKLLFPGDPSLSILSLRMHDLGTDRMPPLATSLVDPLGTGVIDAWIDSWLASCVGPDSDGDLRADPEDNCTGVANADQADVNAGADDDAVLPGVQHYGDACDAD
ncbi:MAG: PQQ-dependent sugar dehydrogenase, partial [Myxococcota bacterium]|nr:PQQ-dependent sugar dehydrogenase [Myxococcota bacterium]